MEKENFPNDGICIHPNGFREYDVRWLYPEQINLDGMVRFGQALGTFYHQKGKRKVVVGHDWRHYSLSIKQALITGLRHAGCDIYDIGLSLSPMAYFAQQALEIDGLAMVTASHNENGWTGVKMSHNPPLTFLCDEVQALKELVTQQRALPMRETGKHYMLTNMRARYLNDLIKGPKLHHPIKVVVGCGNGTAGHFAPQALRAIGATVIPRHCTLDDRFPHYNPNPENMHMLADIAECVVQNGADIGFAFDGDGDRCGIVDAQGREIFADKVGILLSRFLLKQKPKSTLIVDVKSTNLYLDDPILASYGAHVLYWKTGHSYMKQKIHETGAIAGFEKSGHAFFAPPFGRGYDDGLHTAIMVLRMLDASFPQSIDALYATLAPTWLSPTMSPYCPDDVKYKVVERITHKLLAQKLAHTRILGQPIAHVLTINGIRITLQDGTWGLIRASSNKPNLVIVVESRHSKARMIEMFTYLKTFLEEEACVGGYDQVIAL